jgi:hypothetical protein
MLRIYKVEVNFMPSLFIFFNFYILAITLVVIVITIIIQHSQQVANFQ